MLTVHQNAVYKKIEDHVLQEIEKFFNRVPFAREFHEAKWTNREYYKRHIIEAILRIDLNNEVDAYCLYKISCRNKSIAKKLVTYLAEEYGHDSFFINDLKEFGIEEEEILNTQPFFSTQLLIGYLYYSIESDGAMPTIVWNWLVEWYSNRYNTKITMKAEEEFGIKKVEGVMAHLQIDRDENHLGDMFSALEEVIKGEKNEEKVKQYLTNFIKLIGMYFQELHDQTIVAQSNVQIAV
jgi:hypothetical protein